MTLDATFRDLVREAVRDAIREVLPALLKEQAKPDEFLTVDEAAAVRKVKPATIRAWIRSGRLHADGRPYRILRRDLTSVAGAADRPTASEALVTLLPTLKR